MEPTNNNRIKELAGELCYLLLPDEIGIDENITSRSGWAKKLYLGGSISEDDASHRPKAAQLMQAFMSDHSLTVGELFEVLIEVENSWKTVSTVSY